MKRLELLGMANAQNLLGLYAEAADLQRRVLDGRRRVLGETHENKLQVRFLLADTLVRAGDLDEAREIHEAVLPIAARVLGPENYVTRGLRNPGYFPWLEDS